ncbi:hypothetical protein [Enterococcus sp. HY326]|uniref:hypothetical protein n=1 Tax=Enterococcus sp. HY326 TaxID=2971265 RepID=UPI00223EA0D3|nr:hypothetical protein [Enterococcus sp. HY326]
MNELEFRKWLNKKGVSKKMQSDHTSRIKKIEKEINHCDIDNEYHNDKCITLLAYFEKNGCNNQMDKIKNCDLPIGKLSMSNYKYSIKKYIQFKNEFIKLK